jgi:hypothetical protein
VARYLIAGLILLAIGVVLLVVEVGHGENVWRRGALGIGLAIAGLLCFRKLGER